MIDEDKPSLEELVHHGVKGMRWGVRNAYADRVGRRGEEWSTFRNRAAAKQGEEDKLHAERIKKGEATVRDLLKALPKLRVRDLIRGNLPKPKNAR